MRMGGLWPHQEREVRENALRPRLLMAWSPRLGKTKTAIESMKAAGPFERGLVVAPLVVCPFWARELEEAGFEVMRGYGMTGAEIERRLRMDEPRTILILNYDKVPGIETALLRWKPVALIADESHYLKSHNSQRGKVIRRIAKRASWVRLLTGTPTPNHYGDLWGQMACIDDRAITLGGWGSWTAFKAAHLIMDPRFPTQVRGHVNIPQLQERLTRDASFVRREDVFGPDQYQEIVRDVTLPPDAMKMYRKLAREWILDPTEDVGEIRADHVLKRLVRLQQIAAGFVPDEGGLFHHLHRAKLDAVAADLGEIVEFGEKVVIFHKFRWEGDAYAKIARDLCGSVWEINGDTPTAHRDMIVDAFKRAPGAAVVIAQTKSAGIGISLAAADHAFFTSQSFSFADEDQARDRVYARDDDGVKARCITYYVAVGTVDVYIRDVLRTKTNVHESVRLADREAMAFGRLALPRKRVA